MVEASVENLENSENDIDREIVDQQGRIDWVGSSLDETEHFPEPQACGTSSASSVVSRTNVDGAAG